MKQRTCIIKNINDAVKILDEIKNSPDYINASAVLINIFTERVEKEYIADLSETVKSKLEKARVTGLTCMLGYGQGERYYENTILTALLFYKSEIKVTEYDFSKISEEEAKKDFLEKLNEDKNLKGIQVFATPSKSKNLNEFLTSINLQYSDVPVFGAGAAIDSKSDDSDVYVFGNQIYENGIILTSFSGDKLKIFAESTMGWTPIGKELKVTEVSNNRIVKKIDNEIAGNIYKKYLGVTEKENFLENTCEFPFMLQRGHKWIARMPISKDDNGYIHFFADIHKGEKLQFSYGSKKFILQQSLRLADYMSRKNLEGLLFHVCRNRLMYLKEQEELELQALSSYYREAAGCYAFSEILYKNKSGGLQNSALVAIGFREFEDSDPDFYVEDCFIEDIYYGNKVLIDFSKFDNFSLASKNSNLIPFEERIIHFLNVTTQDLYDANSRLEAAATTDGLTGIFNRKKISERIEYELKKKDKSEKLVLIMFDIDNFKRVNDTYGHDMGDEVLIKVSATAKQSLRPQDSIGRWGGEEFMILLTEATKEEAIEMAEKIRKDIFNIKWEKMNQISVSLGVSEVRDSDDIQTLYKRVDNRLYYAKTHGKNQVVFKDEK